MGILYFGDNLDILREHIQDNSIDLIYLDPPFNSKRDYNLLFKTPKGHDSDAQISAFDDTWHWGEQAEHEFSEILHQSNTDVSEMIQSMRRFLKESDMMAYLTMMANRLLELHRVLKPTGSLYLHCDPTASHYLKILMDAVFGPLNFINDIVWERYNRPKGSQFTARKFGVSTDNLLFYSKTDSYKFYIDKVQPKLSDDGISQRYTLHDEKGPFYSGPLLRSASMGARPNLVYQYKGYTPGPEGWRMTKEKLIEIDKNGDFFFTTNGIPRRKLRPEDQPIQPITNIWTDIYAIGSQAKERLGYPTQKPLALLERIIQVSSVEGNLILDPFCGCGTAVHAAQLLKREWIGIDITHLAISLIEKRMKDAFPNITFEVHGTPKDLDGARNLAERDKYQFQWWTCSLVNAQPYQGKKKGADTGIDGFIFFQDDNKGAKKIIVSVKGGEHVSVTMVKDLIATVEREKAAIGLFITLTEPTRPMTTEAVTAGFYQSPKGDVPKIQILTIEGLITAKERPQYYDMSSGAYNFKKAKIEERKANQDKLEGF
jgi:adenine specific DNA methylase Mod